MTCIWEQDENGNWFTICGEVFVLEEGTPFENGMRYCCYCGKQLKDVPYTRIQNRKKMCNRMGSLRSNKPQDERSKPDSKKT